MVAPYDVVIVPFPYTDRLAEKRRPALVISSAALPAQTGKLWVAMITTSPAGLPGDVVLSDLDTAGLPKASILRASKITTIEAERVLRQAGRLSPEDEVRARAALSHCAAF